MRMRRSTLFFVCSTPSALARSSLSFSLKPNVLSRSSFVCANTTSLSGIRLDSRKTDIYKFCSSSKSRCPASSVVMSNDSHRSVRGVITDVKEGRFQRKDAAFRSWIKADGSTDFTPEVGRYRLYISLACPWASRCFMTLSLKGLLHAIPITVVHYHMGEKGWRFVTKGEKNPPDMCEPEPEFGLKFIQDLYHKADANYNGRFSVPVLWDTKLSTIVSNESSEIIVMLNNEFDELAKNKDRDLYPKAMRSNIDSVANSFYNTLNNGVYRCGFATTQEAYEEAFDELVAALENLEKQLGTSRYICGDKLTLADIRLFPTLVRFDPVYVVHFMTNWRMLKDYPNLLGYTRELYQIPEIRKTVNISHIKYHYFTSHPSINPLCIVPKGPDMSYLDEPHGRDGM